MGEVKSIISLVLSRAVIFFCPFPAFFNPLSPLGVVLFSVGKKEESIGVSPVVPQIGSLDEFLGSRGLNMLD